MRKTLIPTFVAGACQPSIGRREEKGRIPRAPISTLRDVLPDADHRIKLQVFEGPLDLLLFLIRKNEIDIYDIPIESVTKQYVAVLRSMQQLDLEVAGEFFVMAASLMEIKSRMLLPKGQYAVDPAAEGQDEIDPRWELVHQLLQYKKFKDAASDLNENQKPDAASKGPVRRGPRGRGPGRDRPPVGARPPAPPVQEIQGCGVAAVGDGATAARPHGSPAVVPSRGLSRPPAQGSEPDRALDCVQHGAPAPCREACGRRDPRRGGDGRRPDGVAPREDARREELCLFGPLRCGRVPQAAHRDVPCGP